jgi:3-isopropylmalate/(R)-2-methylmalate dehydratase large subunit
MAKDVILHVIGDIGFDGATYRAMQWEGPGVQGMNMDDRMTIANMAIEAGGKNAMFPCDQKTIDYVNERVAENGTNSQFEPVELQPNQRFIYDKVFDLSKLEPTVACHPDPGNRKTAKELHSVKLDRAYIGSCTGGKTSDFLAFAQIVRGKSVVIDTFGVPATTKVVEELKEIVWDGTKCLVHPRERGRAHDGKCVVCCVSWRASRHVRPFEYPDEMHLGNEPKFSGDAWVTRNRRFFWPVPIPWRRAHFRPDN